MSQAMKRRRKNVIAFSTLHTIVAGLGEAFRGTQPVTETGFPVETVNPALAFGNKAADAIERLVEAIEEKDD